MRRDTLTLHLVVAAVVLLAGCTAPTGPSATAEPTASATATPTATAPTTPTPQPVTVEYAVRAGSVPDDVASVEVTLQVVFVERAGDMGPCWRDTFTGPYKPTVTPIAPPEGECHRSESVTVDLTELDGERSLGGFTAPGRFTAGHALVATNVTATYRNGTTVRGIRGASGKRVRVVEGPPAGPYRVSLSVEAYDDRPYDYWVVTEE